MQMAVASIVASLQDGYPMEPILQAELGEPPGQEPLAQPEVQLS